MPKLFEKILHNYLVTQVPLSKGIEVKETESVKQVVKLMQEQKTGCVITIRADQTHGIFTERDLLQKVMNEPVDWNEPVSKFATPSPVTMQGNEPLRKALYLMRKKNVRHIPIFSKENELKGVLSVRNIVKLLAEHFPAEVMNLPPRLNKIPTTVEGG